MKIFEWELKQKNIIAKEYSKELEGYYRLPLIPKNSSSAWAQFTLQTKRRSKVLRYLKEKIFLQQYIILFLCINNQHIKNIILII